MKPRKNEMTGQQHEVEEKKKKGKKKILKQ